MLDLYRFLTHYNRLLDPNIYPKKSTSSSSSTHFIENGSVMENQNQKSTGAKWWHKNIWLFCHRNESYFVVSKMTWWTFTIVLIILSLHCNTVISRRGKFKDSSSSKQQETVGSEIDKLGCDESKNKNCSAQLHDATQVAEKKELLNREVRARYKASVVVVIVFLFVTVGMFLCCRYIPELIMDKCNYWFDTLGIKRFFILS